MANTYVSNQKVRKQVGDIGMVSAYTSVQTWRKIVAGSKTVLEAKEVGRELLPGIMLRNSDIAGSYSNQIYMADRKMSTKAGEVYFQPQNVSIADKAHTVTNTLTSFDEATLTKSISEISWHKFEQQLAKEASQLMFDKFKRNTVFNSFEDELVVAYNLYVSAKACSFCCLVASGHAGRARVKYDGGGTREYNRTANNEQNFRLNRKGNFLKEAEASLHLNCSCIWRPEFASSPYLRDEVDEKRLKEFRNVYDEVKDAGTTTNDIRGSDGILSEIRKVGGFK